MARMGDWRDDKDKEVDLDGIGGVNILVKADVHRSGRTQHVSMQSSKLMDGLPRHQFSVLRFRKPSRDRRLCQDGKARRLSSRWPTQLRGVAYRYRGEGWKRITVTRSLSFLDRVHFQCLILPVSHRASKLTCCKVDTARGITALHLFLTLLLTWFCLTSKKRRLIAATPVCLVRHVGVRWYPAGFEWMAWEI